MARRSSAGGRDAAGRTKGGGPGAAKSARGTAAPGSFVVRTLLRWHNYTKYLREQSIFEGLLNGRKVWLAIGAVVWGAKALRWASRSTERVVLSEILQPGDQILISQIPTKVSRKQRKAAKGSS